MDKNYTAREWKCKCGLILGVVVRSSSRVLGLNVYRVPVLRLPAMQFRAQILARMFVVHNLVEADVQCNCGRVRRWALGEDAMEDLMEKCGVLEEYKLKRDQKVI